jgi:hypothetical protein
VQKAFRPFQLTKLYTDIVPLDLYAPDARDRIAGTDQQSEDAAVNFWFQSNAFGETQLPLYAILEPLPDNRIKIAGVYAEGKINDPAAFAQFLKKPFEANATAQAKAE